METDNGDAALSPGWPSITIAGVIGPFTGRCQAAIDAAREAASAYRHRHLGTEHLLLGLLTVEYGVAAQVLRCLGITHDRVREWIEYRIGTGNDDVQLVDVRFAPKARDALHLAVQEHEALGHLDVGTEHLLLGVSRVSASSGAKILADAGTSYEGLREAVTAFLAQRSSGDTLIACRLSPSLVASLDRLVQAGGFDTREVAAAWCIEAAIRAGLHPEDAS